MIKEKDSEIVKFLSGAFVFFSVFCSGIVSAQTTTGTSAGNSAAKALNDFFSFLRPIFDNLFGDYQTNDFLLVKLLVLILLFVVIYMAVSKFPGLGTNKAVVFIVAAVVSILSVRYMTENQLLKGILLPYGVLGMALVTIIPFLIFFFFVHSTKMGGLGRRILWGIFGIVFLALFITRYSDIGQIGKYIYLGTTGLILISFIFDRGIHRYFFLQELNLFYKKAQSKSVASLQAEYINILDVDTPEAEKRRKDIEEHLKRIGGNLP